MTSVVYHGHVPATYLDYTDLATGQTLTCEPGGTYDVAPASGSPLSADAPVPADGCFTVSEVPSAKAKKQEKAAAEETAATSLT